MSTVSVRLKVNGVEHVLRHRPRPRDLLRDGPVIEVGHLSSGRDVDTPDDLEAIRNEARAII